MHWENLRQMLPRFGAISHIGVKIGLCDHRRLKKR
jgi:hypothetical protein